MWICVTTWLWVARYTRMGTGRQLRRREPFARPRIRSGQSGQRSWRIPIIAMASEPVFCTLSRRCVFVSRVHLDCPQCRCEDVVRRGESRERSRPPLDEEAGREGANASERVGVPEIGHLAETCGVSRCRCRRTGWGRRKCDGQSRVRREAKESCRQW